MGHLGATTASFRAEGGLPALQIPEPQIPQQKQRALLYNKPFLYDIQERAGFISYIHSVFNSQPLTKFYKEGELAFFASDPLANSDRRG
mmetsp:Transcript_145346/g.270646  ORF Transcript_145346/g.270646 Transcript_145346/m.270646 type:complete len:89 (-) Transcript_145346:199-465(-)